MTDAQRPILVHRRARTAMDKAAILVFATVGGAAIWTLKIYVDSLLLRVVVPCGLLLLYAALTILRTRYRLRYDQVGDNCYYLGFIYTLMSLGIALYLIQGNVTAGRQVTEIIRDFGVALSTTLVGIVLRVFLNQLREDPHDIEEAAQLELYEQSQRLSGQVRAAIVAIDEVRTETADKLKNYVFAMHQIVQEHENRVVELRDATSKLAQGVEKLAADLGAANIPTGRLREAAAETVAALEGARNAMAAVESGGRGFVTQIEATSRAIRDASGQVAGLASSSGAAAASAVEAQKAFDSLAHVSRDAASRMLQSAQGVESAMQRMASSAEATAVAIAANTRSSEQNSDAPRAENRQAD